MATIQSNEVKSALDEFFNDEFSIEDRILVRYADEDTLFENINYGLNDFSIAKKDSASMIVIHTFIKRILVTTNREFFTTSTFVLLKFMA